jgi:hypothetical protein
MPAPPVLCPDVVSSATEVGITLTSFPQYEPMKLAAVFSAPSLMVAAKSYAL